jgi:hypothetical protein
VKHSLIRQIGIVLATGCAAVALAAPASARPFTQDNYIDVPQTCFGEAVRVEQLHRRAAMLYAVFAVGSAQTRSETCRRAGISAERLTKADDARVTG